MLVFDYRGYGRGEGNFPSKSQVYEDANAAWNYLRDIRNIPSPQIIIYGESLVDPIALDTEPIIPANKSQLGKRLRQIRAEIVSSGEHLFTQDELENEIANRCGGLQEADT